MKLLCAALIVLLGHQALTKPRNGNGNRGKYEKIKANLVLNRGNTEATLGNPGSTTGNDEATTGKPWVIEPRHEKTASLANKKGKQMLHKLRALSHHKLKANLGLKRGNTEATSGNPETTTETHEVTTGKHWVIEPRHENVAPLGDKKRLKMLHKLKALSHRKLKGCKGGEFLCDADLCVSEVKRCDGRVNCVDGTDEVNCDQIHDAEETKKRIIRFECGSETNQASGTLNFPNDGANYPNNEDCLWIIAAGKPLNITFTRFQVEAYYDSLVIRNGNSSVELTGYTIPGPFQTSGEAVNFHFTSDYSVNYQGFEIHWEPLGCHYEISQSSGTVNYPIGGGNYQNNEDCTLIINAGQPIRFNFTRFQVEEDYDFLTIRDGDNSDSSVLGEFTGYTLPHQVETTGNSAFLQFTSDSSVTYSGFDFHWAPDGCGEVFTTSNGHISHPSNGGNYENDENCVWKINAAEPISITFVRFALELNYDFLYIRNGQDGRSPLLGSFTGSDLPSPVETTQGSAYLLFSSDQSVVRTGFEIRWEPVSTSSYDCECGQVNRASRIVNGIETEVNEYPWQAAMVSSGTSSVFCGASVIGARHILTAAHCTQAVTDNGLTYQVLVGAHSLSSPASSQIRLEATRFIQHPNYNPSTVDNDISIIELSSSIDFGSSEIRPVCLPANDDDAYNSVTATVSGWGTLEQGGSQPDVLMEVDVPTMSNSQCLDSYTDGITDNMICAGYEEGGKDSCQGDSGGPLIYNSGVGYTQIGVVSWGFGCAAAEYPGVYARITKYLTWISTNAASSTTCSPENNSGSTTSPGYSIQPDLSTSDNSYDYYGSTYDYNYDYYGSTYDYNY